MVKLTDKILRSVEKPARYVGKEFNSITKDGDKVNIRFAFCFPDVYDVGMSHLGIKILYHILNKREDTYCERVFAPWTDMEEKMRQNNIPLYGLESKDPITDFDFVAFTLQYELSYTNILNMLDLAHIPVKRDEREKRAAQGEKMPFVLVGGPCAYNCEPIADFVDIVSLGEGEEHLNNIMDKYNEWKGSGKSRTEFLESIADIPGTYIPSFYNVEYNQEGLITSITPKKATYPEKVTKVVIKDMDLAEYPDNFIVPFVQPVHDRAVLEAFRGCTRGCRFCQAGMIYRPVREKSPQKLLNQAKEIIKNTGYDELAITSLSTSDYKGLNELLKGLSELSKEKHISLSVPSLRLDSVSRELINVIQKEKNSSFTFAPEAGTQRLRDVINKNISEEDLEKAVSNAFLEKCKNIKLYFMIGLPTETEEDIDGIVEVANKVLGLYYKTPKEVRNIGINVTVSTSSFVPKAFTPFQWVGQDSMEELIKKQEILKKKLTNRKFTHRWHNVKMSLMEAAVARGDRRLGDVIYEAWRNGCKFDGWEEKFKFDIWMEAFKKFNLDPEFYACRKRDLDEILPWSHIDTGVTTEFLKRELSKAQKSETSRNCMEECQGCGATVFNGGVCFE